MIFKSIKNEDCTTDQNNDSRGPRTACTAVNVCDVKDLILTARNELLIYSNLQLLYSMYIRS